MATIATVIGDDGAALSVPIPVRRSIAGKNTIAVGTTVTKWADNELVLAQRQAAEGLAAVR